MLPDRVSNAGPLTYELGALLIALRGPAIVNNKINCEKVFAKLTLLHPERPKLHRVLAIVSAIGLKYQFLITISLLYC